MELLERDGPLARLGEAAAAGGSIVVVRGEAGLGKTSLVRAFLDTQAHGDARIGRCDDASVPVVLGPFRDILATDGAGRARLDVDDARVRVGAVMAEPGVVVIEDMHWADEASLDLLTHLARRMGSASALLVLTMRTTDNPHLARCLSQIPPGASLDIELRPLSKSAVTKLAEKAGRDGDEVFTETAGNPFLVSETLAFTPGEVPTRVAYATSARLAPLSESAHELAGFLSVFPSGVAWARLAELWPEAEALLDELEQGGLIEASTSRIAFRHELIRRAVDDGLTVVSRRRFNQRILDSLDLDAAEPAVVAHHAHEAGDVPLFVESTIVAARDFARAGAHRDALRHLERVAPDVHRLAPRERAAFTEALGNELVVSNRFADADPIIHDAVEQWRRLGDTESCARALNVASKTTWHRGDAEQSLEQHREALALLEGSSDIAQVVQTQVLIAQAVGMLSRWPEALRALDRAVSEASGLDPEVEAIALGARGNARRILGDELGGSADEARSIDLALQHDLQLVATISLANRVATSLGTLGLARVEEQLADGLVHADRAESERGRVQLLGQSARLDLLRGRWDEALATARALQGDDGEQSLPQMASVLAEGLIRVRRGDDTGVDLIENVRARAMDLSDIQRLGQVGVGLCELVWLGKIDNRDQLLSIAELARTSGHVRFAAELHVWLRRLSLDNTEPPEAGPAPLLAELAGDWKAAAEGWAQLDCPYHRLLTLGFSDDPDAMREAVNEAVRLGAVATADRLRARLRDLGHRVGRGPGHPTLVNPGGLTRRQVDVVKLLAAGHSNQQIADSLFISPKTVDHHVSAILTQLGVVDRYEAGEWATEQGLT